MKYDVKKCIDNIRILIKRQGKKIGDLETKVGLSTGYLSKVYNNSKQDSISIGTLEKIANELNISLDIIMYFDCESIENNEKEAIYFLDNIRDKTLNKKLIWRQEYSIVDKMPTYIKEMDLINKDIVKYFAELNEDKLEFERNYNNGKYIITCTLTKYYNSKSEETMLLFSTESTTIKIENKANDVFNLIIDMAGMFNLSDTARGEMINIIEGK